MDEIDGSCVTNCDPLGFRFNDWAQTTSLVRNGYVQLFRERRAMPIKPNGSRNDRFLDAAPGANPAMWSIGRYGRGWSNMACTEDGTPDNSGGCIDPEGFDEALFFARFETIMVPARTTGDAKFIENVVAQGMSDNLDTPLQVEADPQIKDSAPPPPGSPCAPTIGTSDPHTGAVHLSVTPSGPCGATIGTRFYRAISGANFTFLRDLKGSYAFVDFTTQPGVSYQYKAVSYSAQNVESTYSAVVSVTPTDTTPPPPPTGISGFGGSGSATVDVAAPCSRLVGGIYLYLSLFPGGPYTKVNTTPIAISARPVRWSVGGLQNGTTYYVVATLVDFSGNESAYSSEVAIIVGP